MKSNAQRDARPLPKAKPEPEFLTAGQGVAAEVVRAGLRAEARRSGMTTKQEDTMQTVANLNVGDKIKSPFSGARMTVIDKAPDMYDLIALTCRDSNGDRHLLTLAEDESVKVIGR